MSHIDEATLIKKSHIRDEEAAIKQMNRDIIFTVDRTYE